MAVAVADHAWGQLCRRVGHEFVSRGEQPHHRLAVNFHFADAQGSQPAQLLRAQQPSRRQRLVAPLQVFTLADDVFAGCHLPVGVDLVSQRLGIFQHDHGIGAFREHPPGMDEVALAFLQGPRRGLAHQDFAGAFKTAAAHPARQNCRA